ncbi:hypothetical protein GCM10011607_28590 [Shewanella inventionis]|uniref:DUF4831 family protein n=1 Tax=Shewanella inventionis TaxID=1738770 RepID=A0ABQ1JDM7_9GAMM|nr:hypothetical protein [Shewanella inventionis]GGB66192.1 hypothetical protein GCM10011607_28590 [Shewanella inventionis]
MKILSLVIVLVAMMMPATNALAQQGEVKESGYKIPVGMAVSKIVPHSWKVMFTDNTMRNYQITWSKGDRWTNVLDQVGMQYDLAFVADARSKVLYVSETKDLLLRGITLVASSGEAKKINLSDVEFAALDAEAELNSINSALDDATKNVVKIENEIYQSVAALERESDRLASTQSKSVAYGNPANKSITMDLMKTSTANEIELYVASNDDEDALIEAGELLASVDKYFTERWNYEAVYTKKSLPLIVTLPHSLRMPSTSMADDVRSFSDAINNKKNSVNVFFKVVKGRSLDGTKEGQIQITIANKQN